MLNSTRNGGKGKAPIKQGDAKMKCIMCAQPARYIVNRSVCLCEDCFNPDDPEVSELKAEGLVYEELGGDDDSNESE